MKKMVLLIGSMFLIFTSAYSGGYKIKITVHGIKDTIAYFGYYYADKQFAKDTLHFDANGFAVAQGKEKLDQGIYLVIFPSMNNKYFEVLINDDQTFSLETDTADLLRHMKVKGNDEVKAFYDYQVRMLDFYDKVSKLNKEYKAEKDPKKKEEIKKQIQEVNKEVRAYWESIVKKQPNTLLAAIVKALIEPEIPEFNIPDTVKNKDSLLQVKRYYYIKNHYFDNLDLSDPRLLHTPLYYRRVNNYFTKLLVQNPDTIIKEGHKLIKMASGNHKTYQYMVAYMLGYYERTKIMGMDKVFLDIAKNYYLSGKADWVDSTFLSKLEDRVRKIEPNIIGEKAHDLKPMEMDNGAFTSLYKVDADYTILVFWDPGCGHCKKAMPKIKKIHDKFKNKNVEVFAVCTITDTAEWKKFIREKQLDDFINVIDRYNLSHFIDYYDIYSTPVIYLLDKDKKIIAKRIDPEQLDELLEFKINGKKIESEEGENSKDKKKKN
jgi:thiol-disulfide isomerase/thioredoxin